KDSVIRSNPFTVTISGDSQTKYVVFLEGVDSNEVNPYIPAGQSGFKYYVTDTVGTYDQVNKEGYYTAAVFETDASGNRVVQYNTEATTEDKTYTIRVSEFSASSGTSGNPAVAENVTIGSGADYDTVKVKVEKGAVTITASGDGQYYIGAEITLSGTNTDSDNIFLFITGPNLLSDGVNLKTVGGSNQAAYLNNQPVSVKTDDTWEYKWDTSNSGLDTGSYTIYATSVLTNGKSSSAVTTSSDYGTTITGETGKWAVKLSDSEYGTVSVSLKQPFLSATPSGTIVAKGDDIYIRGTAEGDPSKLQYYIFGPNKFETGTISVEDDGTYEKKLTIGSDWASNQYYVVIEHPMYNGDIDVKDSGLVGGKRTLYIENVDEDTQQSSFIVEGQGRLQSSNAANALTTMIDNANIDDVYTKLTFTVDEPRITITNPGDQATGTTFTISGTTNLAVGDQIIVDVQSSSFTAVDKSSTSITDGVSVTTTVVAGEGTDNVWSVEVDTTNWKLDEYTIKASGIEVDVTATTNFNLVEKVATPTATATGATPTTTATATATATATPATPGFGAFVALAGLGAVALLVLRRN
ncbi:MAG TPA: MEMAR_RS02690 family S-layer glycoprotein, partial [Methanocorpusculum sp.]|nr:MEMAR_RS02690 family S-layer glycoprotein [Methanocorpusculum sp.]